MMRRKPGRVEQQLQHRTILLLGVIVPHETANRNRCVDYSGRSREDKVFVATVPPSAAAILPRETAKTFQAIGGTSGRLRVEINPQTNCCDKADFPMSVTRPQHVPRSQSCELQTAGGVEGAPYLPPAGPEKPVGTIIDSNGELARLRLTLHQLRRRCLTAVLRKT